MSDQDQDQAYGPRVTVQLKFDRCHQCQVTVAQSSNNYGVSWHSATKQVRSGSVTALKVPTSPTVGAALVVNAAWAHAGNWVPVVVTDYKGYSLGHTMTRTQAAHAARATGCWAGVTALRTTISVATDVFAATDIAGNPTKGLRAYARSGLIEGGAPWLRTLKGSLGTQERYYC